MKKKQTKIKKENKQIVEIHIYVHQNNGIDIYGTGTTPSPVCQICGQVLGNAPHNCIGYIVTCKS